MDYTKLWDSFESIAGGIFITISGIVILIEVLLRMIFNSTIIGSDEIACFMIIWSVFFTASIGIKTGNHVKIDIFLHLMPPKMRQVVEIAGSIAAALFCIYFTYSGFFLVAEAIQVGDKTVGTIRTPLWLPQLIMPVGGILMVFRLLGQIIRQIRSYPGDTEEVADVLQTV
jgi:C4-dicarboxylate transporter, DctQ subunit